MKQQIANGLTTAEMDEMQILEYIEFHYDFDDDDLARYIELSKKGGE